MRMTMTARLIGGFIVMTALGLGAPVRAGDRLIYDFFSPYLQRYDGIQPATGDAKEVNAATHVIDPWPPYVGNRRIPGDSERMANAIRRYHDVSKLPCAPPTLEPVQVEKREGFIATAGRISGGGADCKSSSEASGTAAPAR